MNKLTNALLIIFLFLTPSAFSHETGEHEVIAQWEYLFPMIYLDHGEYFSAVVVVLFWIGLIHGIYTLTMMTIGRLFHDKK